MSNEPDKINSGALATMIVLVALATLAVALVVTALVRQETARLRAEGDQNQERPFRQLRSEQESKLTDAPAWVDQSAGLASVSISSAMQMVLENVRENPLALSPGNKPAEEEEEEDAEADEASDPEASGTVDPSEGTEGVGEESSDSAKPGPTPKTTGPAPKTTAPSPEAPPAPKTQAPSPAPSAPKQSDPAPAPGGSEE